MSSSSGLYLGDPSFNEQVVDSITRAIDAKFGEGVRRVLFWKFEETTKLQIIDIPRKPDLFVDCMRKIFGAGADSIERAIVEGICNEFKIVVSPDAGFVRALQIAKSKRLKEDLTEG
jgi:hypothetical protein